MKLIRLIEPQKYRLKVLVRGAEDTEELNYKNKLFLFFIKKIKKKRHTPSYARQLFGENPFGKIIDQIAAHLYSPMEGADPYKYPKN